MNQSASVAFLFVAFASAILYLAFARILARLVRHDAQFATLFSETNPWLTQGIRHPSLKLAHFLPWKPRPNLPPFGRITFMLFRLSQLMVLLFLLSMVMFFVLLLRATHA
jgi:hypothetical protein